MIRLLVADDDVDVLETTVELLRVEGFHAEGVSQAEHILARLAIGYDVLLQDIHMPRLDVGALIERVRRDHPRLHVILFSAAADAVDVARRVRADGLVTKPFDLARLKRRIELVHRTRTLV